MLFFSDREDITASVIGLGYVGSCLAATLAESGVDVIGIDTNALLVQELTDGHCRFQDPGLPRLLTKVTESGRLRSTTNYELTAEADVVIITVGTPVRGQGEFIADQLRDACKALGEHLRRGQLVLVKSTVPPGAMRELVIPLLEESGLRCGEDFGLAFCPERLSQGAALAELRTLPVVVGGCSDESADAAERFWSRTLGTRTIRCSSLETAEVVKLANNWWIDHNIALANELARFCSAVGVDVMEVIHATNSAPKGAGRINILLPGVGVGGSCLTKDPWMVWHTGQSHGVDLSTITTARTVNDAMPAYTAALILGEADKAGVPPEKARIAVIGLAFKNNTGDVRSTPTAPVVSALVDSGAHVTLYDPLVEPAETVKAFPGVLARTAEEAVEGADCLAILAWHQEFEDLDFRSLKELTNDRCVLIDGRAHFSEESIAGLRSLGFIYRGIGR